MPIERHDASDGLGYPPRLAGRGVAIGAESRGTRMLASEESGSVRYLAKLCGNWSLERSHGQGLWKIGVSGDYTASGWATIGPSGEGELWVGGLHASGAYVALAGQAAIVDRPPRLALRVLMATINGAEAGRTSDAVVFETILSGLR